MSPSILPKNKHLTEDKHFAEDKDLAEHDDLRVKPLFFHRPSKASTYHSAESIATPPPESDSDDEQIRALLASPLYMQERAENADRSQVYHSVRENLMSSSSEDPKSTGRPVAFVFKQKQVESRTVFRHKIFPSEHHQVLGNNEPSFRFSHPENSEKSLREGHRDHMLAEAKI